MADIFNNNDILKPKPLKVENSAAKASRPAITKSNSCNPSKLDELKENFDLLSLVQNDLDEAGHKSGKCISFKGVCPICGHKDCFRVYPNANGADTFHCFSSSGDVTGTCIDYLAEVHFSGDIGHAIKYLFDDVNEPLPNWYFEKYHPEEKPEAIAIEEKEENLSASTSEVKLSVTDNGTPRQTIANCIEAISKDELLTNRFRYNSMAYTREVVLPLPWKSVEEAKANLAPIRDTDYTELTAYLETKYSLTSCEKITKAAMAVCERNSCNPLTDWLTALQWDGKPRITTLLHDFLGTENSKYFSDVMQIFMLGAISRAFQPGCKFDYTLSIVGDTGIKKSSFARMLAINNCWFGDAISIYSSNDEMVNKIRGFWIVELAEVCLKADKVDNMKSFLTTQIDTIRPKYARETEQRPRVCVFIITTNETDFLNDPTGNRRYLPVQAGTCEAAKSVFDEGAKEYFIQAWAEAMEIYRSGNFSLILSDESQEIAEQLQHAHNVVDEWEGLIDTYIEKVMNDPKRTNKRICSYELLENAIELQPEKFKADRKLSTRIKRIMDNKKDWKRYEHLLCEYQPKFSLEWYEGYQRCYIPVDLIATKGIQK